MPENLYLAKDKIIIRSPEEMLHYLSKSAGSFYVYVLCRPSAKANMQPFYVGIGQGVRLFAHEEEAKLNTALGLKVEEIRKIWSAGCEVIRVIDSFYEKEPWCREEEPINHFGLIKDGTGILTNEQRYSPSHVRDGVELRKYVNDGNELPSNFNHRNTRLQVGPCYPKSSGSVYGKIYAVLESNPGVTGSELVELLLLVDFSENKSAYTQTGAVSKPWLTKYIDGGFYEKNLYIQEYKNSQP